MADSRVATGLSVEQWDDKFFTEYLTENRFAGEMGTNEANIIQVKENLMKKPGDRITYALVNRLTQDAVTGRDTMEGNEEDMISRSFEQIVNKRRNAVRFAEVDEQFSAISLRNAAKHTLKDWSMKDTETLIIQALASINGVQYASATETQKDAWLTDNADRVYFGERLCRCRSLRWASGAGHYQRPAHRGRHLGDEVQGAGHGGPENPPDQKLEERPALFHPVCRPAMLPRSQNGNILADHSGAT